MSAYFKPPKAKLLPYLEWMERYEVRMLRQTAMRLDGGLSGIGRNAYIESFLIHARNLYDFFAQERPTKKSKKDTICARHYLPSWDLNKAKKNAVLKNYFGYGKPANTKAFHLSLKRLTEAKTDWPAYRIWQELEALWSEFVPQAKAAL